MKPKFLVELSVKLNNITFGPNNWTLCARFYQWKINGSIIGNILVSISDKIFWYDEQHCRKAWYIRKDLK